LKIVLLGSAAGGGFPQWNCWCPACATARADPSAAQPRTQSSAAISVDGRRWFLLNASPDVREQLQRLPTPEKGVRRMPVEGVVLTDAEIDHSFGLIVLREGGRLPVYATRAVQGILESDSRVLPTMRAFGEVPLVDLRLNAPVRLCYRDGAASGLTAEAFAVPAGPPRFASAEADGHTVGLMMREEATEKCCAFVPGCGALDDALLAQLAQADAIFFDGTFWSDDELIRLGIGRRTAREMDHLPIAGPGGSLERLAGLSATRIYTHINNTNPILLEQSPERAQVVRAGITTGYDGLSLTL
jgi:pyrroloquinoline quinone biosynthesis protein B